MREMKDSGVEWLGEVPAEWALRQAGQLAVQTKVPNEGMIETNLLSLSYGKVKRRDINATDGLLPASFETYNVIGPNDIVLRFTDLQNDQKSLRVGRATERGIITSAYVTVRPLNPSYSRFMYYALHAYDLRKGFYGMGAGVRQGLKWQEAKYIKLPWPGDAERDRIADFLDEKCDEIDRAVSAAERSIEEYKAYKTSEIVRTFDDRETQKVKLPLFAESVLGKMLDQAQQRGVNTHRYLANKDVQWFRLETDKLSEMDFPEDSQVRYGIQDGDILVCEGGEVGRSAVYRGGSPDFYFQKAVHRVRVNQEIACPEYVAYQMFAKAKTGNFMEVRKGQATFNHLTGEQLRQLRFLLPPLPEQRRIADYLDEKCTQIDAAIAAKQAIIADLKAYKQSLIYEAVTGKREV